MTSRLYYHDSLKTSFEATVISSIPVDDVHRVVLDRTAFYPTSGGQPHDTGRLAGLPVVDVVDEGDEIVHVVQGAIAAGATVEGVIDWPRRLDHMQQHTGQHMLSAAFDRLSGARTVSFHLGDDASTIDLAREVTPAATAAAELEANRIIWEDRLISVRFASEDEAARLPLRKEPVRTGPLRLVEVTDFDLSACGGTHVTSAGMVGQIAVAASERFKGGSRVTFVCGGRAIALVRRWREVLGASTRALSIGTPELPAAIERLRADVKTQGRTIGLLQDELAGYQAAVFRDAAETIGPLRGVLRSTDRDGAALKTLAAAVVQAPGLVAVLTGAGRPVPVVAARSADVTVDLGAWMQRAVAALGGRGGGRPEFAQGGLAADPDAILEFARVTLKM